MKPIGIASLLFACAAVACGGAAAPHDQLATAQAAIRAAEVGGAGTEPQAALLVKKAQDQIAEAKKLMADDENERAAMTLARAQVDAELALTLAQEKAMRLQAEEARTQAAELQKKLPTK